MTRSKLRSTLYKRIYKPLRTPLKKRATQRKVVMTILALVFLLAINTAKESHIRAEQTQDRMTTVVNEIESTKETIEAKNTELQKVVETTTAELKAAQDKAAADAAEIERLKAIRAEKEAQAAKEAQLAQPQPAPTEQLSQPQQQFSGDVKIWLSAAGIPETDWHYADCVINGCEGVSGEGGWHGTQRWNTTGSGAYGLCQALPAGKMSVMGQDWQTNPITQLKWCHAYAMQYGGWIKAWNFRKCLGSCYSSRTNTTVYKDHTWW